MSIFGKKGGIESSVESPGTLVRSQSILVLSAVAHYLELFDISQRKYYTYTTRLKCKSPGIEEKKLEAVKISSSTLDQSPFNW